MDKKKSASHTHTQPPQSSVKTRDGKDIYISSLSATRRVRCRFFGLLVALSYQGGGAKEERRARCVHYVRVGKTPPLFCDGLEREIFGRKARKTKANENTTEDISSSLCDAFAMFLSLSLQQQQQQRERDFCSSEEEEKDEEDKRRG